MIKTISRLWWKPSRPNRVTTITFNFPPLKILETNCLRRASTVKTKSSLKSPKRSVTKMSATAAATAGGGNNNNAQETALVDSILSHFMTAHSVQPSRQWVSSQLESMSRLQSASSTPNPSSLFATLDYRFKASELSESMDPATTPGSCLPAGIAKPHNVTVGASPTAKTKKVAKVITAALPVVVQVMDIWDTGSSRIDTLERIEMAEQGVTRKGQQIIRVTSEDDAASQVGAGSNPPAAPGVATPLSTKSSGPHKLLLEDAKGERVYAFEFKKLDKVDLDMSMGTKLLLRDVPVLRGVLLLEPKNTTILGGKIEELQQSHRQTRKEKLLSELQAIKAGRSS